MKHRGRILLSTAILGFFLFSCESENQTPLTPTITSEDLELDTGGNDIEAPPFNACVHSYPQDLILQIASVENGTISQSGINSASNPAIIEVGATYGNPTQEPLTKINVEFITTDNTIIVGPDPQHDRVFLHLLTVDMSNQIEFLTDYVANDPYPGAGSQWIGNRVARWQDDYAWFDGILPLNQIFILQSCRAVLTQSPSSAYIARSQAVFVEARLRMTPSP